MTAPHPVPLYGPEHAADPQRSYELLRAQGAVGRAEIDPGVLVWVVTDYRAALDLLQDPGTWTKDTRGWDTTVPEDSPVRQPLQWRPSLFFADGEITRTRFKKARLAAAVQLEFLERRYRKAGWDVAIGASGTVRGVWRVMMSQGWCEETITREGLEKVVDLVIERGHVDRIDFESLREDRRPVFAGGLAALAGVFDALRIKEMETSERALR